MTNTANRARRQAATPLATFAPVSVTTMISSQRAMSVAFDISRGSGAVRGSKGRSEAQGDYRQRPSGGHSETEQGGLIAENYEEADLQYVTLKVWRPVKWVTDGGREHPLSPPFSNTTRAAKTSRSNRVTHFSTALHDQLKTLRDNHAVSNYSRGSGAVRGNKGRSEARGDYRQRPSGGHSETEQGGLIAENYEEADLQYVTLKVWRPVKWVTDGGREHPLSPPYFSTQEA